MQGPIGKAKHLKDMAGGPVGRIKRKIGSTKSRKFRIHLKVLPSISQATVLVCYCAVSFDGHLSNFWQVYSYLVSHLLLVIVVFCEQTPSKLTGGELHLVRWQRQRHCKPGHPCRWHTTSLPRRRWDAALEGQRQGQLGLMRVPSSIRNEGAFRILMVIELS